MGKQAAAYGLGALGVGTTITAVSAVAGGAGLMSALGAGIIAAFPPALIAAGVAALAAGVRTAYVNEWDKNAEDVVNQSKAVFADEDASFWKKLWEGVKLTGKIILASIAGGIREVVDKQKAHVANISEVWADDEKSFGQKLGGTAKEIGGMLFDGIMAPVDYAKGAMKTFGKFMFELLPESAQGKLTDLYDRTLKRVFSTGGKLVQDLKKSALSNIRAIGTNVGESMTRIVDNTRRFLTDASYRQDKIEGAKETIGNLFSSVGDLFKNAFNGVKDHLTQFMNNTKEDGLFKALGAEITQLFNWFKGIISNIFTGTKDLLNDKFGAFGDAIRFMGLTDEEAAQIKEMEKVLGKDVVKELTKANSSSFNLKNDFGEFLSSESGQQALSLLNPDSTDPIAGSVEDGVFIPSDIIPVNDAIVKPDGTVIKTAPTDTIFATKNNIDTAPTSLNPMATNRLTESASVVSASVMGTDAIVEAVMKVVNAVNNKPFNNIVQNVEKSSLDFESMRSIGIA